MIKKVVIFGILSLFLSGCDIILYENPIIVSKMNTICLDGVAYYLFREKIGSKGYGYMSVKFDRSGNVILCDKDNDHENEDK